MPLGYCSRLEALDSVVKHTTIARLRFLSMAAQSKMKVEKNPHTPSSHS